MFCNDQSYFLRAQPALDLLLAGNSGSNIAKHLKINELVKIVFLSKTGNEFQFVLKNSLVKIVGHADIEHSGFVAHEIHKAASSHWRKPQHVVILRAASFVARRISTDKLRKIRTLRSFGYPCRIASG